MDTIAQRLRAVEARIHAACQRAGRLEDTVLLVAVTKQRSIEEIKQVLAAGCPNMGENYAQEALEKTRAIGPGPVWHFIGHLQRNKVKDVVPLAELIHSIDSLRLAEETSRRATAVGKVQRVLLEVNVSGEESKWGLSPAEARQIAPELAALPGVHVEGLMTMAPLVDDPEEVRPVFAAARELARELSAMGALPKEPHLSMGMTNDFEVAIEEGATIVRIGTAVFGPRDGDH